MTESWGTWAGLFVLVATGLALLVWRFASAGPVKTLAHSTRPAFDPEEALELCGGDQALFEEIALEVAAECWSQIEASRTGLRAGDASALRAAAHRLRGSLLAVAATPSAELAATLERRAIAEELSEVPTLLQTIEGELRRLERALSEASGGDR